MANTFTQLYIHIVFSTKHREPIIAKSYQEELHKYITGIVRNQNQKLIAINSMPDHIHILIGLKPTITISDLVRDIKRDSSAFVNEKRLAMGHFGWQEGYGGFSYGHSQLDSIIQYIQNQEQHHRVRTFKEEYLELLDKFHVEYDPKYVFD